MANHRELDHGAVAKASVIAVDSLEQSREESADLIQGLAELGRNWEDVVELHSIVAGTRRGRTSQDEVTLFKSNGIALWDVAVAGYIYRQALEKSKGKEMQIW
jgi:ornithine cyclodeaminase/alanine dehydrogenase-like protein (mu-crystallin family)